MKLSCLQENLAKGLGIVGRAVATRSTFPITQNVLLAAEESRLKLSATNLEIAITTWVGARVEKEGVVTIPARLLTEFVNTLPSEQIDIEATEDPTSMHIQCARFEAHMAGIGADEFPPLPSVDGVVTAKLDAQALKTAINQVAFAAATTEERPVLMGVHAEFEGDKFVFAAADGFRLAVHWGSLTEPVAETTKAVIPAKTLSELNRLLDDQEGPVEFTVTPSQNQIMIHLSNANIVSPLKQGTFPNYTQLIPNEHTTRAVVGLRDFLRATRTASVFARDGSGIVRLQFLPGADGKAGSLEVSSRAEEIGENKGQLDAMVEGQEAKIAFSSRYLAEVLNAFQSEEVIVELTNPSSPGVFRSASDESYVHVVMPMFVQW